MLFESFFDHITAQLQHVAAENILTSAMELIFAI